MSERRRSKPVHPRACGEQPFTITFSRLNSGSSPRLRGTDQQCNIRIASMLRNGSSPRLRGTGYCGCLYACRRRFIPRLRGTGSMVALAPDGLRFIPAPAGNRSEPPRCTSRSPVHPRACGEQHRRLRISFRSPGSSPRLRGTVIEGDLYPTPFRFIPAPAGNRPSNCGHRALSPVHPRACGEQDDPIIA